MKQLCQSFLIKTAESPTNFDSVFSSSFTEIFPYQDPSAFIKILFPLLENVFYLHKDCTIIGYGLPNLKKTDNLLKLDKNSHSFLLESIEFLYFRTSQYTKTDIENLYFCAFIKYSEITVSCFEIYMNEIHDLLKPHLSKEFSTLKEPEIAQFSCPTITEMIELLEKCLKKRKINSVTRENLSHIFINIGVIKNSFSSFGNALVFFHCKFYEKSMIKAC